MCIVNNSFPVDETMIFEINLGLLIKNILSITVTLLLDSTISVLGYWLLEHPL